MEVKEENQEPNGVEWCEKPQRLLNGEETFNENNVSRSRTQRTKARKSLKCHQCETSFTRKENLDYHLKTHTGEKTVHLPSLWKEFHTKQTS